MNNTWFDGIVALCFLALGYLFTTKSAPISGAIFVLLAVVFAVHAFVKKS